MNERLRFTESPSAPAANLPLFRTLAKCAPVVVWMTDASHSCVYISPHWREFTGRPPSDDLGFKWVEALHPDDRDRAARDLIDASALRQPCHGEYRVMRADGRYGWLRDHGVPYFQPDGSYAGHIGTCIDITEHKDRERSQSSLLLGQESERKRVARELHDDIGQRLALLTVTLAELSRTAASTSPALAEPLTTAQRQIEVLAQDLHRISHNLHPSIVAHLGLVGALHRLCSEFSQQMLVAVEFVGDDSLPATSQEVALALYRVTQEALSNVVRHSQSAAPSVSLTEHLGTIHLTISDLGVGFDVSRADTADGLGLTSIRERVRMIAANVEVRSSPSHGTTIEVQVPLADQGE